MPESGGEILIWEISEDLSFFEKRLDQATIGLVKGFYSAPRKLQFLAIRYLLKLSGKGEEIHYHSNGKPYLERGSVSISHTPALAGIYLTDHSAGLDIEALSPRIINVARRFMGDSEKLRFGMEDLCTLTLLWSAKEAIYKKYGGDTAHFSRNIEIEEIEHNPNFIVAEVRIEGTGHKEKLSFEIRDNIVITYTL